ncbi:MAG: hypothetical protein IIC91_01615 [Chloroflexi bacterium]|nr:hypothetical protein [Chloroflexota bacterium]
MAKRRPLPDTREGVTHSVIIHDAQGDIRLHIRTGTYTRGKLGEVFITAAKAGSTLNGLLDLLGRMFSYNLQYGAPVEELIPKLLDHSFAPSGETDNPAIPNCSSLPDYLGRWLDREYGNGPKETTEAAA